MEVGMKKVMMILLFAMIVHVAFLAECGAVTLCNVDENDLMACKPAVSKPDPVEPSTACCKALSGADLVCLCSYKNSSMLPFLGIDPDLVMGLPAKCNITPPAGC